MIKVGSDFSGVGAFDQALLRIGINYKTVFACDMDKYARETFIHNYGEPEYYPKDVYERDIPSESLDIYMTSPPCQSFSLAGKRKGEHDDRGVLFYNSHEFIKENRPKYFIFENVKGLLSDAGGLTFRTWCEFLGGKSINGNPIIFPHEESVPYHIYFKVLNAKDYNIPQNRERVFIVGIRDDEDNQFTWPKEMFLTKRLKDILEDSVDEKYYLSDKMVEGLVSHKERHKEKGNGFQWEPRNIDSVASCLRANAAFAPTDNSIKVGYINQYTQASQVYDQHGLGQTICAGTHGYANGYVSIGTIRGRNPDNPTSQISGQPTQQMLEINQNGTSNALTTVQKDNVVVVANLPGKHEQNSRVYGTNGLSPTLTTMQGGGQESKIAVNDVVQLNQSKESGGKQPYQQNRVYADYGVMTTLDTESGRKSVYTNLRIRRLTPRECFRLMDFPDSFTWPVSDSQAYKQAGNSICVGVLAGIIEKLNLTPLPNKEEENKKK